MYDELAKLIQACMDRFSWSALARGCGCGVRYGEWPSENQFLDLAFRFGLEDEILKGFEWCDRRFGPKDGAIRKREPCDAAPITTLIFAWGHKNSRPVPYITVFTDGAGAKLIRLHCDKLEEYEEIVSSLKKIIPSYTVVTYKQYYDIFEKR